MYNREFELDLISYCLSKPFYLKQHKERLEGLKFSDKYLNLVYKELFRVLDSYKTVPTKTEFQKILNDSMSKNDRFNDFEKESVQEIITSIYDRYVTSLTGVSISNYLIKEETTRISEELTGLQAQDLLEQIGSYERRLSKLRHFISDDEDLGLNMFSDGGIERAKRLLDAYNVEACIPTGYPIWDKQLQGGLRKGELMVILASTGVGKTATLLNLAANMLNQDYRVVYVAMDNVEGELIARTVGCLMDRDITQKIDPNAAFDDVSDKYTKHYTNNFIIKHFAPRELTKSKLERYLDRLEIYLYDLDKKAGKPEDKCGKIDVLVLDYLECMLPESGAGEFWIAAEHLAQEIKAVLKNRDILGLTATQGGTEAMKSDTMKLHMAQGAKSRFNAPDLVFGISQNEDEKRAKPASKFRLSCLKARRAKTNYEIAFEFFKEKQVIREDPVYSDVLGISTQTGPPVNEDGTEIVKKNNFTRSSSFELKDPVEKIVDNLSKTLEGDDTFDS